MSHLYMQGLLLVMCHIRCVMVIVTGYGHGDTSSIPGRDW